MHAYMLVQYRKEFWIDSRSRKHGCNIICNSDLNIDMFNNRLNIAVLNNGINIGMLNFIINDMVNPLPENEIIA